VRGGEGDGHFEAGGDVVDHSRARHFGHDGFDAGHVFWGLARKVDFVGGVARFELFGCADGYAESWFRA